nr:peptide-methionine (S)-S-oxide reductase MsrA [Actinomyces polynesiensis]
MTEGPTTRTIHLAGGCLWGIQKLFSLLEGVVGTEAGYANGPGGAPTYEEVCADSGHVEAVRVTYDTSRLDLATVLDVFLAAIDPVAVDHQGDDEGVQYRTGIYWTDEADLVPIPSRTNDATTPNPSPSRWLPWSPSTRRRSTTRTTSRRTPPPPATSPPPHSSGPRPRPVSAGSHVTTSSCGRS